jgi:hypothetical protein
LKYKQNHTDLSEEENGNEKVSIQLGLEDFFFFVVIRSFLEPTMREQ